MVDILVQINRQQIKDYVPEKMLKEHFGSPYDSSQTFDDHPNNNISLPHYEWQTLLSYDHWPTLFSFYNISCDNRYLTIMPSIYLPIISENELFDKTTKASFFKVRIPSIINGRDCPFGFCSQLIDHYWMQRRVIR